MSLGMHTNVLKLTFVLSINFDVFFVLNHGEKLRGHTFLLFLTSSVAIIESFSKSRFGVIHLLLRQ